MTEKIGVMTDICYMKRYAKSELLIRGFLLFVLLVLVKGPETFSEEHLKDTRPGGFFPLDQKRVSVSVEGKTFSFIVLKNESVSKPEKAMPPASPLKEGFSLEINSKGHLTPEMLTSFITLHNPALDPLYVYRMATIYVEEASDEGINWDVAFSQMCLETAYLKFGGDVLPGQNNFCGLGVTGGGVKGASFSDMRAGIRAHIQHLKAYASNQKLANPVIDDRFKYVKRGSAPEVHKLTGKWATDKKYGEKIHRLMEKMYSVANGV